MSKGRKISMMEQIKQHTSIRKYQDKPIPQQVMDNIFTAIQMAPSWINGQQYSVIRVTDKGAREQPLVKPRLPREAVIHTNTYKETTREQLEAYNEEMLSYMKKRGTNSTWTQGVANFYSKGYSGYSSVVDSMKKQGFKK